MCNTYLYEWMETTQRFLERSLTWAERKLFCAYVSHVLCFVPNKFVTIELNTIRNIFPSIVFDSLTTHKKYDTLFNISTLIYTFAPNMLKHVNLDCQAHTSFACVTRSTSFILQEVCFRYEQQIQCYPCVQMNEVWHVVH